MYIINKKSDASGKVTKLVGPQITLLWRFVQFFGIENFNLFRPHRTGNRVITFDYALYYLSYNK